MDYFLNTEFIDRDRQIDLISLAVVAADGRELYAISTEFEASGANDFVRSTVLPLLEPRGHPAWMSRARMKDELLRFVGTDTPRFWSWGGAPYDWLSMAQLFPLAERVPDGWRYTAYDVSLLVEAAGLGVNPVDPSLPPLPPDVHHAPADARWVREVFGAITTRRDQGSAPVEMAALGGLGVGTDYFIDTEREIDLISVGIAAADGRELYAISTEFDARRANDFVRSAVLPRLEPPDHPAWMSRARMKDELVRFIGTDTPRFWSWGGAPYDWMTMAQLFPVSERIPDGWRYTAYDVLMLVESAGLVVDPIDPSLPRPSADAHHALTDARWAREVFRAVTGAARR